MGRKNRRRAIEYEQRLGFNPDKYTKYSKYSKYSMRSRNNDHNRHTKAGFIPRPGRSNTYPGSMPKHKQPYRIPYRGEIWVAQLGSHPNTSVQEGCRPVLIVSNDKGNHTSNTVVVLPLTSQIKRSELPSHVELRREEILCVGPEEPVPVSMILAEQITTISKSALGVRIGRIRDAEKLREIDTALMQELSISVMT